MKVLVIGSGAREHALAERIAESHIVTEVLCAPGNGGTAQVARNVALECDSPASIVALARREGAGLVVVGPEAPIVAGVADELADAGVDVFAPPRAAAVLEGSKAFAKRFMARHGIATAAFGVFDDPALAHAYVERHADTALVVKADGLAAGKGVIVTSSVAEAHAAIDTVMRERAFGAAGTTVVIEERLVGQEVSFHVVLDGRRHVPLCAVQDHKAVGDGDRGPNTGGMGAYSPPPVVTSEVQERILRDIVEPTVKGLAAEALPYRGVLFIGLMIVKGVPYVLEYNVRFGDPEAQVILARYGGDIMPLLLGAARGDASAVEPSWQAPCAMCVVLAAGGYPGPYMTGTVIEGLDRVSALPGVRLHHAGTRRQSGQVLTHGGRVLGVTAVGLTIDVVAERAYQAVDCIRFAGMHFRRDIGHHARRS